MHLSLHTQGIQFYTNHPHIEQQLQTIFAGWPPAANPHNADLRFHLELTDSLPPLPVTSPIFTDDDRQILRVYQPEKASAWLHFLDGGWIRVPLRGEGELRGFITSELLAVNGRLEDVIYTSLAPLLRRRGLFMVHAFAASKNGRSLLLVGPSHSGKTSTGLNLLLHGWELLANDVVLLHQHNHAVHALPTPGTLGIRPHTFELLPRLQKQLADMNGRWSTPCPVTTLLFPQILPKGGETAVLPHNRAIALTQLMAESMDRWDTATLAPHLALLQQLCQQATTHQLHLGSDIEAISARIEQAIL